MTDLDKLSLSIEKLQPNSEYVLHCDDDVIDETVFNKIDWKSSNSLTWTKVKAEMDKL